MMDIPKTLLKAQATGDVEMANTLNSGLSEDERERYYVLALALFAGAIGHRLGDDATREDITSFVNEVRYDFRDAEPPVNALAVEVMIRAVFGEDQLLDDLSAEEQYLAQLPVIRKIVAQSEEMQSRLDDYLTDAEALADQWTEA